MKKKRRKAKEKEPTQRRCLIHVVNVKGEVPAFMDHSWQVTVYLVDQLYVFGMNTGLESRLKIIIYFHDGTSIFFDIILVRSVFKCGVFQRIRNVSIFTIVFLVN